MQIIIWPCKIIIQLSVKFRIPLVLYKNATHTINIRRIELSKLKQKNTITKGRQTIVKRVFVVTWFVRAEHDETKRKGQQKTKSTFI